MLRKCVVVFALLIVLFGCLGTNADPNKSRIPDLANASGSKPLAIGTVNDTAVSVRYIPAGPNDLLDFGDQAWVDYTLTVDDKVYDTSNATIAKNASIFNPFRKYEPLRFKAEVNGSMINGFVFGVIGLKLNEAAHFEVEPALGYGFTDLNKLTMVGRYYNRSLYETIPTQYLISQGINITPGKGFQTKSGTVFINNTNSENTTLFYLLTPGHKFMLNGIPQKVVSVSNLTALVEFDLQVNKTYEIPHPSTGELGSFLVLNKTNGSITLDGNHPLANKTLVFDVVLRKLEKPIPIQPEQSSQPVQRPVR